MTDNDLMSLAMEEARKAEAMGEVPIGAVIAMPEDPKMPGSPLRIIGRGHNRRECDNDPTAHAEMLAIHEAARTHGHWRLENAILAVTLEPCPMCAGAIVLARIARLVYGATDPKAGAAGTLYDIPRDPRLNHRLEVTPGIRAEECGALLSRFFADLRKRV